MIYTTADVLSLREIPIFSIVPSYINLHFSAQTTQYMLHVQPIHLQTQIQQVFLSLELFSFGFI